MRLEPTAEQREILAAFDRIFHDAAGDAGWVADEPALWASLVGAGAPLMRCPTEFGGSGLGSTEAALVVERLGHFGSRTSLVDTIVAAQLFATMGDDVGLSKIRTGSSAQIATSSLAELRTMHFGTNTDVVVAQDGERIIWFETGVGADVASSAELPSWESNNRSRAFCELGAGPAARSAFEAALAERRLLHAAYLAGWTIRAIEDAAAYATERVAFGRPIGSFQAIAHPLADAIVDLEGARLLVHRAIAAIAECEPNATTLLDAACWWVRTRSGPALLHSLRVFGGHGVASDHPAARRFVYGRALALQDGDPDDLLDLIAAGRAPSSLPDGAGDPFDWGTTGKSATASKKAREFFGRHLTPELRRLADLGEDGHDQGIQRELAAAGLLFPHWNGGADLYELAAMRLASARAGWNLTAISVTDMAGAILMKFGSAEVQDTVLPRFADGTANCALGYTEPSGGSDVFAATTRAVREGDHWRINGQKTFTSQGHFAEYSLLIARTDPNAAKHRGITIFLLPLNLPGYGFTAISMLGGERTNTTYYDGMLVPDAYRIGPVDGGASVLAAALELEQNCGHHFLPPIERMIDAARGWMTANRPTSTQLSRTIAAAEAGAMVLDCLASHALWNQVEAKGLSAAGPMAKLFGSEMWMKTGQSLLDRTAPASIVRADKGLGIVEREARRAVASTIYGGTSEIQRSLIAEGRLRMPRSRT